MSQITEAVAPRAQGGSHSFAQTLWQLLKAVLQVCLLSAIWIAMDVLRQHFGWSMPAGLIGFGLLAVGLFSGLVKARWLQSGTNWLLAEMLLFFVPAMLVVTEYPDLIRHQGLRILAVIVASTACVMAVTALAVDRVYRFELWLARRKSSRDASALDEE
ncbi:CidA/LrgA family protein [Comamonas thiooxydans]|uniref:LrgA n=1 Tax=Comamonas thiooxydans TaxID=363952 RepID=A0A0E3C0R7_9BURK|nr:CidA/LrgA family protein [Comamonas thiooxydans]KGH16463.1 LrgA [Comamonas thiooxydans]KGH17677.1 LrgA [Comamonas thiooxydans]KGH25049.1 LrgA [Comamonas thiooxydans]